jgi:uncharacterized protein
MDKVVWFELPADDTGRAADFYAKTFGWDSPDMGAGSRMLITTPSNENGEPTEAGAINGDISPRNETFNQPTLVVAVADLEDKIKKVEAAGGRVVRPREELKEMKAAYALVADTEGNVIGLLQDL